MAFVLPFPSIPQNGQSGDATPILANFVALAQAIASFDGSQLQAKSVGEAALADAINPRLRYSETLANFVYSGCIWAQTTGLVGTMTGGTIYVNGYRTIVTGVATNTFGQLVDTYIDIDYLGNITYLAVSNGSASPSLTANSIRVAKVITDTGNITSVVQSGFDSHGNRIYYTGAVAGTQAPGLWWEEISRVTMNTSGATMTTPTFTGKKYLKIIVNVLNNGGTIRPNIRFNADTGNNYGFRFSANGGADTTGASQSTIVTVTNAAQNCFLTAEVENVSVLEKQITGSLVGNNGSGAANIPGRTAFVGKWANNSSQITSVTVFTDGTGTFDSGSETIILGHD